MAGSFSDYTENKVLDHICGKAAFVMPVPYLALFTVAPSDSGGGTEVVGGAYARKQTQAADWSSASGGAIANANTISFVTATGNWGNIVAGALMDAPTGGNMLLSGPLPVPKTINVDDTLSFPIGNIDFTLD